MVATPKDQGRREFMKMVVVTAAAGSTLGAAACGDDDDDTDTGLGVASAQADIDRVFPQGLASGDPTDQSVILWTRAEVEADTDIDYEVATDAAFAELVASGTETVTAATDYTLRLKVDGLEANTGYYYKFRAQEVVTAAGRTRTAPGADAAVPVRFAVASCQDFRGRYYHAWRHLVESEAEVDFVVFLGDYIYETDENPSGAEDDRKITLAEGMDLGGGVKAALTLADYRSLYKQYRSDEWLKKAHALFPFVTIWDDHEFSDDCWQDHGTYFNDTTGDEQNTARKTVANQAWFEYQPVDIERVEATYPDDMHIYRSLRFGALFELFLTDQRSYRSDHLVPEGPEDLEVGKFQGDSSLGSRYFALKPGFDVREAAAGTARSMLGAVQKAWLIAGINGSNATWKFWGSETQLAQYVVDLTGFPLPATFKNKFYVNVDQWDGWRSERAELTALAASTNVVAVTGDIHGFYASELHADFDNPGDPTAVEFVGAGISSESIEEFAAGVVAGNPTLEAFGLGDYVPQLDTLLQETGPHMKYAKSLAKGIVTVDVTAEAVEVAFVHIANETEPDYAPDDTEIVRFRVAAGSNSIERV